MSDTSQNLDLNLSDELLEKLTFRWADFRPVTPELPGTGGSIRQELEDFKVEEVPLYLPQGSGTHVYTLVEKRGLTTRDLVTALMAAGVPEKSIGFAGQKDKFALTKQWLSVPDAFAEKLVRLDELGGVRVLEQSRHKNKLALGHLTGNRFSIRVRGANEAAFETAQRVVTRLQETGIPNYFGPQRFGRGGVNAVDGYKLLRGERVPGGQRLKRFFISALQSLLFNHLLDKRIATRIFDDLVLGDWAKKHDTGGEFRVDDAREGERAERFEVSATLPLYGKKVKVSGARAGATEQAALEYFNLRWTDFKSRRGDRRLTRLALVDSTVYLEDDGYRLEFFLPKGAFATSLLREVMKVDIDGAKDTEDG